LDGMYNNVNVVDTSEGGCGRNLASFQTLLHPLLTAYATYLAEALPQSLQ